MRSIVFFTVAAAGVFTSGCAAESKPATPLETFRTYTKAVKQKDTTTMKLLLSSESLNMHEQEAKSQNTTVDEIVKRESLFNETQTEVKYRNETIEGERATIEIMNAYGTWETIPFVFESNQWKIDKKGYAERISREIEEETKRAEEEFNQGRIELNDTNQSANGNSNANIATPY